MLGGLLCWPLNAKRPARSVKDWQMPAQALLDCNGPGALKCCRVAQWHASRKNDHTAVLAKREMCIGVKRGGIPAPFCRCVSHNVGKLHRFAHKRKKKRSTWVNFFTFTL
jgi:hypothetical protein